MSFQILNEHSENPDDILASPNNELHMKALRHDHVADGGRTSLVQQDIPKILPWSGLNETNSTPDNTSDSIPNMDTLPTQFELHSNTKTHQLGGVYESYSAFN